MTWARSALQLAAMAALLHPPRTRGPDLGFFQPVNMDEVRQMLGLLASIEPLRPEDVKDELGYTPRQYAENEWRDRRAQEKRQRRRERNLKIAQKAAMTTAAHREAKGE